MKILVYLMTLTVLVVGGAAQTREYIYADSKMLAIENYGCGTPFAGGGFGYKYFDGSAQRASIATSGAWNASTNASWISFPKGTSGSGSSVCFALAPNDPVSGAPRVGTITINGVVTNIAQRRMSQKFGDLPPETQDNAGFHYDTAHLLFEKGITTGCQAAPRNYCGTRILTRAEMAVFFIRSWSTRQYGTPEAFLTANPPSNIAYFADVPAGDPTWSFFFPYIQKMYELGITSGCLFQNGVRTYCPSRNTINIEAAIFTVRTRQLADGLDPNVFSYSTTPFFADVPASHGNFHFIQKLHDLGGVVNWFASPNCSVGYFCEQTEINRGEKAKYIIRAVFGDWNN